MPKDQPQMILRRRTSVGMRADRPRHLIRGRPVGTLPKESTLTGTIPSRLFSENADKYRALYRPVCRRVATRALYLS
jgi:hypothetical protein